MISKADTIVLSYSQQCTKMSDLQANVPSLPEQNASEGNQEAQTETIASTDINEKKENEPIQQTAELASTQPPVDAASEQPENILTTSQLEHSQSEAALQPSTTTETSESVQADAAIPSTTNTSDFEAEKTIPPKDPTQTGIASDTNGTNSVEKRDENGGNDGAQEELSSFPLKQEELQKQGVALGTSNEEPEEGEVEQGTADALEAAALDSQENGDIHSIIKSEDPTSQVKGESLQADSQISTQVEPQSTAFTEALDQQNKDKVSANAASPFDVASHHPIGSIASSNIQETETSENANKDENAQSIERPHQTNTEDVEMNEALPGTDKGAAATPPTLPATTNENVETTQAQPPIASQEIIPGSALDLEQNRNAEEAVPRSIQENISAIGVSAPVPGPVHAAQEDVLTPVPKSRTLQTLSQELTPSSNNVNGHPAGPSGRNAPNARQDEMSRIRKENEDMRLLWLSLPSHDHPSYYSDTDEENASSGSSCAADALLPKSAAGRAPYLNGDGVGEHFIRQKRKQDQWSHDDRDDESDLDEEEDIGKGVSQSEKQYRIGNRGNKLKKDSRWVRKHKLGTSTDARNEKDITERFTDRLKALQRTQVESMLNNAPGPSLLPIEADMLDGSDRLLLKDIHNPPVIEETSILLAPQLLRPILSTRALLQSHTLRHTFRNPHIGALSRTALDLRESESQISRSLTRCLKAMETRLPNKQVALVNGDSTYHNGILPSQTDGVSNTRNSEKQMEIDPHAVGVEGTQGTDDELNPSFAQLDRLFVTKEGLPIPFGGQTGEDGEIEMARQGLNGNEQQTILTADQQREVIRAALECLHELGGDSLEYVERLEEVRSRLAAVKQKRLKVWNALRIWALKREGDDFENESGVGANENDALAEAAAAVATNATSNSRSGATGQAKTSSTTNATTTGGTKRRRVAA